MSKKAKSSPKPKQPKEAKSAASDAFTIVALGASAGGLEAFEKFFDTMPADSGMAFVILQHLDPNHKSMLTEILQKYTSMPVHEITENMAVEANHVYVIPPNNTLLIEKGILKLSQPEKPRGQRLPIDIFFRSLAHDQQERAVGIVLSGTGTDGTLGIKAIKEYGGLSMVQQESSAKYMYMPRNAIATGLIDYVLPVEEMPAKLIEYDRHPTFEKKVKKSITAVSDDFEEHLHDVYRLLKIQTGHDFSLYKRNTILRRVARRVSVHQLDGMGEYVRYLQKNSDEIEALFRELLIGVTNFFRDPEAFYALEHKLLPQLLATKHADDAVRVWVAGCSTGEEAYSLAILLMEQITAQKLNLHLQIFATDIDEEALQVARAGVYPESIETDVSEERLNRFFVQEGDHYQVIKPLRESIIFASHNLIKDPPFSRLDLVTCRNLLIYLGQELQKKLMPLFHYALNPGGFLFLGSSENIGTFTELFEPIDKKRRLFRRRGMASRLGAFPVIDDKLAAVPFSLRDMKAKRSGNWHVADITEQMLLDLYAPAAVVINEQEEIIHYYGRTGEYLEPSPGEPTHNIIRMARQGLRSHLRQALLKAVKTRQTAVRENVIVRSKGTQRRIDLIVRPIIKPDEATGLYLVIFQNVAEAEPAEPLSLLPGDQSDVDPLLRHLERELQETKEDLQSTIEELETSNEELKSANEEMLSVNEELQSTNEELETSKEELQSVNEELITVNAELHYKVDELAQANSDIANLMASMEIPTLILTNDLRIKRFTPSASSLFNLIPTDVDRPLHHVSHNLQYRHLLHDIQNVLKSLRHQEMEVQSVDGDWYIMRILPYRTIHSVIDGVILTFANITPIRMAQANLEKQYQQLQLLYQMADTSAHNTNLQEVFEAALSGLQNTLRIKRVALLTLNSENQMEFRAWHGFSPEFRRAVAGPSPWPKDLPDAQPILVGNVTDEAMLESLQEILARERVESIAFIPIRHHGQLLGELILAYLEPHTFGEGEVQLAQTAANNVAFAIERSRSHRALVNYAQQQSVVAFLGQHALIENSLDHFLQLVVEQTAETLNVALCKVLEWHPERKEFFLKAGVGWQEGLVGNAFVGGEKASQAGYTLLHHEPIIVADLRTETRFNGPALLTEHNVVSGMSVVIEGSPEPYGVLGAHMTHYHAFSEDEIHFLQSISNIVATAMQRRQASEAIQAAYSSLEERVEIRTQQLKQQVEQRRQIEFALQQESEEIKLLQEIATAANEASSIEEAFNDALEKICKFAQWHMGHVFILASEMGINGRKIEMISSKICYCQEEKQLETFREINNGTHFTAASGWPNEVLTSSQPAWISDVSESKAFERNGYLPQLDIKAGFAVPVLIGSEVVAILEFFSLETIEPSSELLDLLGHVGTQLGRVIERERAKREIHRSERMLATAQSIAHVGNWEWDIKSDEMTWSEEIYRIYDVEPEKFEPSQALLLSLAHPDDRLEVADRLRIVLENQEGYESHLRIITPTGKLRYLHSRVLVTLDENGEPVRLFGTVQDETEQKIAEAQIERKTYQLTALNEMGQTVLSNVELDAIFAQVLETIRIVLQAAGVFILLRQQNSETFRFVAINGAAFAELQDLDVPISKSIDPKVLQTNRASVMRQQEAKDQPSYQLLQEQTEQTIEAILLVPIYLQEKLIGLIKVVHTQEEAFFTEDLSILEIAAAWTAVALSNARFYEELYNRETRLRELTEQIVAAQEEERGRISRELHDESAQSLTALKLILETIARDQKSEILQAQVEQARELIQQAMQRIRLLAYDLRPPELDNLGLGAALRDLCRIFSQRAPLHVVYNGTELPADIREGIQLSFYRFLQEALTNVVRHAEASAVNVNLEYEDHVLSLRVSDNGVGFDHVKVEQEGLGLGLLGMKERFAQLSGELTIDSKAGEGATLCASVVV